jgi:hypothetical protein
MRNIHVHAIPVGSDPTVNHTSLTYDVAGLQMYGVQFTLTSMTAPNVVVTIQCSNDVPPSGADIGTGWSPSGTSWMQLPSFGGGPTSTTLTANGTSLIGGQIGFVRWLRVVTTWSAGSGGTIQADLYSQAAP